MSDVNRELKVRVSSRSELGSGRPGSTDQQEHQRPCELDGAIVRSPRDVEYAAFLHPGDVDTYDDLVHMADAANDLEKSTSEDYRHAFIPYYG